MPEGPGYTTVMDETANVGNPVPHDPGRGPSRFATHNVVATFGGPDEARAALVMLERRGVEAGDIELFGPGMDGSELPLTNDEQRETDNAAITAIERRGILGILVGAVTGAVIGGGIAAVASGEAGPVLAGALAGALLVGALGFLWGGFSGMSASEQWGDTFAPGAGETSVAVHSDDAAEVETALEALRSAHARRLATCGPDGRLRDVA
jgi:hypothetical protein